MGTAYIGRLSVTRPYGPLDWSCQPTLRFHCRYSCMYVDGIRTIELHNSFTVIRFPSMACLYKAMNAVLSSIPGMVTCAALLICLLGGTTTPKLPQAYSILQYRKRSRPRSRYLYRRKISNPEPSKLPRLNPLPSPPSPKKPPQAPTTPSPRPQLTSPHSPIQSSIHPSIHPLSANPNSNPKQKLKNQKIFREQRLTSPHSSSIYYLNVD